MNEVRIKPEHLQKNAYIYIRQSTMRQVVENTESTKRQYQLREKALGLGWTAERILVIDEDLGCSGSSAQWRDGFQYLMAEVSMAKAGAIFALEVSRLARSSSDWHRLLEICAITETLIVDEDGIYDPRHFNDRFLLGMKGQMSEAELHILKARMLGGMLNKAQRGALQVRLPIGLRYSPEGKITLDPDQEVQAAIRRVFDIFAGKGSACKVVRYFNEHKLLFPHRISEGVNKGDICWRPLKHWCVLQTLRNPRYTGTYIYGRTRVRKNPLTGKTIIMDLAQDKWQVVIPDHGEGYISWDEYQANLRRLRANALACGADRQAGPAREGTSLLQGMVVCGKCGRRMTIRYHERKGDLIPDYLCQREGVDNNTPLCQSIPGKNVDEKIGELLIEKLTPESIEVALSVFEEVKREQEGIKRAHKLRIARLEYEADLAGRQYMYVDPAHRLVASTLEQNWNDKLLQLQMARDEYDGKYKDSSERLPPDIKEQLLELIKDFSQLWYNPKTPQREKKRILRLMIKDVTLIKDEVITIKIRWQAGAHTIIEIPKPLPASLERVIPEETLNRIRQLSEKFTPKKIVDILNNEGYVTGTKQKFNTQIFHQVSVKYSVKSYYKHLREAGKLTAQEMAARLGVFDATVIKWCKAGLLSGYIANDKGEYLFDPQQKIYPVKRSGEKLETRKRKLESLSEN